MSPGRVVAVDWSGALAGERRKIWLAEAHGERLVRLEAGRSRGELVDELIALRRRDPDVAVGLDFAFSFPAWFVRARGGGRVETMWDVAAREGEGWLARCARPFWGRPGRACRVREMRRYRLTDLQVRAPGIRPKSVFQVGGAGAVGTGSIRGMPLLARLREAGFAIWPFDPAGPAAVVEIFPRLLTGAVTKSDPSARERYLAAHREQLGAALLDRAASSEDAFDAAVSALRMARHAGALRALAPAADPVERLEGRIWAPPVSRA